MKGHSLLALLITALGAVIAVVNLRGGLEFSFPLLLGLLLVADGILRLGTNDERRTTNDERLASDEGRTTSG